MFKRDSGRRDEHGGTVYDQSSYIDCDVFPRNRYGEVKGKLHYDPESGCLVAMTDGDGSFVVSLNGDVVARMPDLDIASLPSHGDFGSRCGSPDGWLYAPQHRVFYRWSAGTGIEERALPTAPQPA